jgi:hypothetical protein
MDFQRLPVAFARRFIDQEMGTRLALKAWYCDSTSRYTETGNLQPEIVRSAQAKRPEGDPKANRESYNLLGHGSHLVDTARFLGGEICLRILLRHRRLGRTPSANRLASPRPFSFPPNGDFIFGLVYSK